MFTIHPSLKRFLYLLFICYTSAVFFINFPIITLFSKLRAVCTVLLIAGAAYTAGTAILSRLRIPGKGTFDFFVYAVALGSGVIAIGTFVLGILGFVSAFLYLVILLLCCSLRYRDLFELLRSVRSTLHQRLSTVESVIIFFIAVSLMLSFIASCAPPVYYDSLVYHMALPAHYLHEGIIRPHGSNLFSYFPATMEMIYLVSLAVGGETAANMVSFMTLCVTAVALSLFLRGMVSRSLMFFGLLLFISSPSIMLLGSSTYVEIGLGMFTLLCIMSFLRWWKEGNTSWLLVSALLGGLCFGTKYTGIITPALLALMIPFRAHSGKRIFSRSIYVLFIYTGIVTAVSSPWLIRNIIHVHNPFYPFFNTILNREPLSWLSQAASGYFGNFAEYQGSGNILVDIFKLLFNWNVNYLNLGGGFDVLGSFGWTFPFLLLPGLFFQKKWSPALRIVALYAAGFIFIWALTGQVLRFLTPLFPAIIILGIAGTDNFLHTTHRLTRRFFFMVSVVFILSNYQLFFNILSIIQPWHVALGIEPREAYLSRKFPDMFPAMQFAGEHLPADAHVYLLGDQRGFYCPRRYTSTSVFAPDRLVNMANTAPSPRAFLSGLRAEGFTHIIHNKREAQRLAPYGIMQFTRQGAAHWTAAVESHLSLLWQDSDTSVYEITLPAIKNPL